MDTHGWVNVNDFVSKINEAGRYEMTLDLLEEIVNTDDKGRFRFDPDHRHIKACQGHSIPWVEPELTVKLPPKYLYHGTTKNAYEQIKACGAILRMKRHAVHMQADEQKAWTSAKRWSGQTPVVFQISASHMAEDGYIFGVTENEVWCSEKIPENYILKLLEEK